MTTREQQVEIEVNRLLGTTTIAEIRAGIDLTPNEIARAAHEGRIGDIDANPDTPAALAALIPRSTW